jgi:tRNA threonylcarbamoyladenosine biosynthesis protein TsaB
VRILALDTSTEACSAALLADGALRMRFEVTERSHADLILPMVDALLAEARLVLRDLDGLAFGRGPGGFTGLRIAAGVVQGLALGAGLRVVPVSSLAAVAEQVAAGTSDGVLVCNDARMGEIYWGVYRAAARRGMEALVPERVSAPDRVEVEPHLAVHLAGNALQRHPRLRDRLIRAGLHFHDGIYPRADAVARLGALELAAGRGVAAEEALPVYVRDEVARPAQKGVTEV